jgi:hypothetical protein
VKTIGDAAVPAARREPVLPTTSDFPIANLIVVPGKMVSVAPLEMVSPEVDGLTT